MLLVLVWGMHFLSNKQLIADNEKSAIYRQYQFMEEKRCISKSLILQNEVIWLKQAKVFNALFGILLLATSFFIKAWMGVESTQEVSVCLALQSCGVVT